MPERHSVQIVAELWKKLCEDAAAEMKKRHEAVTPSQRVREILNDHFDRRKEKGS